MVWGCMKVPMAPESMKVERGTEYGSAVSSCNWTGMFNDLCCEDERVEMTVHSSGSYFTWSDQANEAEAFIRLEAIDPIKNSGP